MGARISRRHALVATAAASTAAALLAACGSSGGSCETQGKRGGVLKDRLHAYLPTLNFADAISALNAITSHVSNTFVSFKPGYLKPSQNEVIPEIVESWEWLSTTSTSSRAADSTTASGSTTPRRR